MAGRKEELFLELEYLLKDYRNSIKNSFREADMNISVDQWMVLHAIGINEGLSQAEIASYTAKEAAAVMRMLDDMSDKDWVARIPTQSDRRKYKVILSKKGRDLFNRASEAVTQCTKNAFKSFDSEKIKALSQEIKILRFNLKG